MKWSVKVWPNNTAWSYLDTGSNGEKLEPVQFFVAEFDLEYTLKEYRFAF